MYPGAREAFADSVIKLRANYGKEKFPEEKCALIWDELKEFSPKQIRNICDVVIGENSYSPGLKEFRDKASMLREKIRQWEKQREREESREFYSSRFHDSEITATAQTIRGRMIGKVKDDEWNQFQEVLERVGESS